MQREHPRFTCRAANAGLFVSPALVTETRMEGNHKTSPMHSSTKRKYVNYSPIPIKLLMSITSDINSSISDSTSRHGNDGEDVCVGHAPGGRFIHCNRGNRPNDNTPWRK